MDPFVGKVVSIKVKTDIGAGMGCNGLISHPKIDQKSSSLIEDSSVINKNLGLLFKGKQTKNVNLPSVESQDLKSKFDDPYWDEVCNDIRMKQDQEEDGLSKLNIMQRSIIVNSFKEAHPSKTIRTELEDGKEFGLAEHVAEFFNPSDPTELLKLNKLHPKSFEWLRLLLNRFNEVEITGKEIDDLPRTPDGVLIQSWGLKIHEEFEKYKLMMASEAEWIRRVQAFKVHFKSYFYHRLWSQGGNFPTRAIRKFAAAFHLCESSAVLAEVPQTEVDRIRKLYPVIKMPPDLVKYFSSSYVDIHIEVFCLREQQLQLGQSNSFFGKTLLTMMDMQGITPTILLNLEIILDLSSPKVCWERLGCDAQVNNFQQLVHILANFPLRSPDSASKLNTLWKATSGWESVFILKVIKSSEEIRNLMFSRIKQFMRLKPFSTMRGYFREVFRGQESKPWADVIVSHAEILAAALSGIDLEVLGCAKMLIKPSTVETSSRKLVQKYVYCLPHMKFATEEEFQKLWDYYSLLGIRLLRPK